MNDSHSDSDHAEQIGYLTNVLQLNPADNSFTILVRRNERLGRSDSVSTQVSRETQKSDFLATHAVADELRKLRAEFWTLPEDELTEKLNEINTNGFSHFQKAVERLQIVANHRVEIEALDEGRKHDTVFLSSLKITLVEPAGKTVKARESMLTFLSQLRSRRRGKKLVARIKNQIPQVYELEAGWFELFNKGSVTGRIFLFLTTPWGLGILGGIVASLLAIFF